MRQNAWFPHFASDQLSIATPIRTWILLHIYFKKPKSIFRIHDHNQLNTQHRSTKDFACYDLLFRARNKRGKQQSTFLILTVVIVQLLSQLAMAGTMQETRTHQLILSVS
jgi:hypothetical protein